MNELPNIGLRDGRPAFPGDIDRVEAATGYLMPPALRQIALVHDGGSTEVCVFDFGEGEAAAISDFLSFADADAPTGVLYTMRNNRKLPAGVIPFARDAGDWLICLDYRENLTPEVLVFVPELGTSYPVAKSFETFLAMLRS